MDRVRLCHRFAPLLCKRSARSIPLGSLTAAAPRWSLSGRHIRWGSSAAPLHGDIDRFGGVSVALSPSDVADIDSFRGRLLQSLELWRTEERCAVWARVEGATTKAIPVLLEAGFDWHHAQGVRQNEKGGYAMLALWLKTSEANRLPLYPSTQVGVGGLVLNEAGEVLLMQERISISDKVHGLWKLPGGLADPGEDLVSAAAREVREETGVVAQPEGIVCLHHRHGMRHGVSDVYFTVRMRAETRDLKPDSSETRAVTWMPLSEAQRSATVMDFNKRILALAAQPLLQPHHGRHGSVSAKADFFLYAAAGNLDPKTGWPMEE